MSNSALYDYCHSAPLVPCDLEIFTRIFRTQKLSDFVIQVWIFFDLQVYFILHSLQNDSSLTLSRNLQLIFHFYGRNSQEENIIILLHH